MRCAASLVCIMVLAAGILLSSSCNPPRTSSLPAGLTVEEHALMTAPTLDPLDFKPVEGTMQAILDRHAAQRSQQFPDISVLLEGHFGMRTALGADTLTATENYNNDGAAGWVSLARNDAEIYRIDIGQGSPVTALRGLWVYDEHWALETAYIARDALVGKISRDGEVLNDRYGYAEAFDFQLMRGRPFYFFKQDGRIGFSYDGQEVMAGYDEVPHYGCCSAGETNPRKAEDMVAFFARRDRNWYYVEVGVFK